MVQLSLVCRISHPIARWKAGQLVWPQTSSKMCWMKLGLPVPAMARMASVLDRAVGSPMALHVVS